MEQMSQSKSEKTEMLTPPSLSSNHNHTAATYPPLLFVFKLTTDLIECSMSDDRLSLCATTCWRPWGKWSLYSPPHMLVKAAVVLLFSIFHWQWITFASYLLSLPETKARLCWLSKCEYWPKLIIGHVLKLPSGQTVTMCFIWLGPSYSWYQLQEAFCLSYGLGVFL